MTVAVLNTYRNRWCVVGVGALVAVLGAGCDRPNQSSPVVVPGNDSGLPEVVATSTFIADWTAQIGGDAIELTNILQPGADPHVYEPVPQDSIALEAADLIFYNGYNLEPNLIKLIEATGISARTVAVAEVVQPLDFDYEGQQVPDPHVWGNVANVVQMVEHIRDELIQLAPEHEAEFAQNADAFIAELSQLDDWIQVQVATIPPPQRRLVTTHDAFQYYATAYGLEVVGTLIGISTEEQPSAQTVQQLSAAIQAANVPAIFAETTINSRLISVVAEEAGVQLAPTELYSDSLGSAGSEGATYIGMMATNTQTIVENLGGNYSPFIAQ
ncbi:MAG: zinc ABC transporter substrate-binding protein [Cyanobacteria bacterium J06639_14]